MAERAEHRTPEAAAVGVVAVEREPRDRAGRAAGCDPRAQQHALPRAGRGGQQRQRALHAGVERVEQAFTRHHRRWPARHAELRLAHGALRRRALPAPVLTRLVPDHVRVPAVRPTPEVAPTTPRTPPRGAAWSSTASTDITGTSWAARIQQGSHPPTAA